MSEREPRRRKKKKDGVKKVSILEEVSSDEAPKKVIESLEDQDEEIASHDPSGVAKSIFLILFVALLGGVGIIFISLSGADRSVELFEDSSHITTDTPLSHIEPEESSKEDLIENTPSLVEPTIIEDTTKESIPIEKDNSQEEVISDSLFDYLWTESLTVTQTEVPITSAPPVIQDDHLKEEDLVIKPPYEVKEEVQTEPIDSEEVDSSKEDTFFESPVDEHSSFIQSPVIEEVSTESPVFIWGNSELPIENEDQATPSPPIYENLDITNEEDYIDRQELDELDELLEKSPDETLVRTKLLLDRRPQSPRALHVKALALGKLAKLRRSNKLLDESIETFQALLALKDIPKALALPALDNCVEKMRFRGKASQAIVLQTKMISKYPGDAQLRNHLAVSYLMIGHGQHAKKILEQVLHINPDNGFAKVHLGFIVKTEDGDYPKAIRLMREGIETREPGVIDGRFYFHLGDALSRSGQNDKALELYKEGVEAKLFNSIYQRSLYNEDNLEAKPWWNPYEMQYKKDIKTLEDNWQIIRDEALSLMDSKHSGFIPENEGLKDTGDWKQFELFSRGRKNSKNCQRTPKTCTLIETMPEAIRCKRGQIKFSVMSPGTHVWAHTGPTNCRLRTHLGIIVPKNVTIRVAEEIREWKEGKVIMFDDSFEHEVWHHGSSSRIVLIVDFWHPDLTPQQKLNLTPI